MNDKLMICPKAQGDKECEEFLGYWKDLLHTFYTKRNLRYWDLFNDPIPKDIILERCKIPKVKEFYVKNGWVGEDVTYSVGDWFENLSDQENLKSYRGIKYHIVLCDNGKVKLCNGDTGNAWHGSIEVKNGLKITEDEFKALCGPSKFKPIPNPLK